jgi:hypothetical protein
MSMEYLYHGSPTGDIEVLEPRQAYNGGLPDGDPAVHAAKDIETAIFMALIGGNRWGGWNKDGFYVHEEHLEQLTSPAHTGFVYVLPNRPFSNSTGKSHLRSPESVVPVDILPVSASDLPADIRIIPHVVLKLFPKTESRWPII